MSKFSIKSQIVESLIEIYQDSTFHAIPRVIKSKRIIIKIIWTVCFLISNSYCSYLVINAFRDYLNYDHVSSVDIYYEVPTRFPSIQICNLNAFQTTKAEYFLKDFLNEVNNSSTKLSLDEINFIIMDQISSFNDTFQKSLSYSLDEILISCKFNYVDCNFSDFKRVFDPYYGNCFSFNSGTDLNGNRRDLLNVSNNGYGYGLRLELYAGGSNYSQTLIKENGYIVIVKNQSVVTPYNIDVNLISSGMSTYIAIERNYNFRLGNPYNDCISNLDSIDSYDSYLFKSFINLNLTYDQMICFVACFQRILIEKCNCSYGLLGPVSYNVTCSTSDEIKCSRNLYSEFLKKSIFDACSTDCPARCESTSFSKSISVIDYPTRGYFESALVNHPVITSKYPNQSISYENLKANVLAISVYYEELKYTVISQQPKTALIDLVSSIGGLFGLFVGISFLSLIEIVEGFYEVICILFTPRKINDAIN